MSLTHSAPAETATEPSRGHHRLGFEPPAVFVLPGR